MFDEGVPTAEIDAGERFFAELARDEGIQAPVLELLIRESTSAMFQKPLSDEELHDQRREWNRQAFSAEAHRHGRGEKEAEKLIARTNAWVRRTPLLATLLETGNLGSDPDVVAALVEHVRTHDDIR